jgi:hypothetical protein
MMYVGYQGWESDLKCHALYCEGPDKTKRQTCKSCFAHLGHPKDWVRMWETFCKKYMHNLSRCRLLSCPFDMLDGSTRDSTLCRSKLGGESDEIHSNWLREHLAAAFIGSNYSTKHQDYHEVCNSPWRNQRLTSAAARVKTEIQVWRVVSRLELRGKQLFNRPWASQRITASFPALAEIH